MNFEALQFEEGTNNMGGLRPIGYYGFLADVDTSLWPEVAEDPADLAANITVVGDITMKATKTVYAMYGTAETAGLKGESQGDRDGRSTKRTASWFMPGNKKEALGAAKAFLNRNMFFLYREQDGKWRLQGSPDFPAEVAPSDDTGTAVTDRKGITLEITDNGFGPCPVYEGSIPVDSAMDLGI